MQFVQEKKLITSVGSNLHGSPNYYFPCPCQLPGCSFSLCSHIYLCKPYLGQKSSFSCVRGLWIRVSRNLASSSVSFTKQLISNNVPWNAAESLQKKALFRAKLVILLQKGDAMNFFSIPKASMDPRGLPAHTQSPCHRFPLSVDGEGSLHWRECSRLCCIPPLFSEEVFLYPSTEVYLKGAKCLLSFFSRALNNYFMCMGGRFVVIKYCPLRFNLWLLYAIRREKKGFIHCTLYGNWFLIFYKCVFFRGGTH